MSSDSCCHVSTFPVWNFLSTYYLGWHLSCSELLQSGCWLKYRLTCSIYIKVGVVLRCGRLCSTWHSSPTNHYWLDPWKCMINRQSHTFSCNLGIVVHAIVKIVLGFTSYNFDYCLVQLFPNRTRMKGHFMMVVTAFLLPQRNSCLPPLITTNNLHLPL